MPPWGYAAWSLAAGALIPVMGALNAQLARHLGGPAQAALGLFGVALAASAFCALLAAWVGGAGLPSPAQTAAVPLHLWCGGLIVAGYVLSVTAIVPRFGVGNAILFIMVAQILTSGAIDHFGLFGAALRPVGSVRAAGLGLLALGLAITQMGSQMGSRNGGAAPGVMDAGGDSSARAVPFNPSAPPPPPRPRRTTAGPRRSRPSA